MKIQRLLLLISRFFLLNLLWEFLHYPLYNDFSGMAEFPRLLVASFFDMLILASIFVAVSIKNKNFKWAGKPSKTDYILIVLMGLLIAAFIEKTSIAAGRWDYKASMLTIFSIGISPLIQLFATMLISLGILKFFEWNKK